MSMKSIVLLVASALDLTALAQTQVASVVTSSSGPETPVTGGTTIEPAPAPDTTADDSPSSESSVHTALRGYIAMETRVFAQSPLTRGQVRNGAGLVAQPEFSYQTADRRHQFKAALFARSSAEPGYGRVDIRELNWQYRGEGWSLLAGMNRVFWGVTESRHVIDVINQSDMRESFVGDVKLGQLMVAATLQRSWGQFEVYLLPQFRMRDFPLSADRPRLELPIAAGETVRNAPVDWAARYSASHGGVDFHTYYFRGVSREPDLVPVFNAYGQPEALKPVYRPMGQIGADIQVAHGAWLFKGELMHRMKQNLNYQAGVGGFEYGIGRVFGSVSDLALLSEFQFDNRPASEWPAPATRGIYTGFRLGVNDKASTEIKAGTVYDVKAHSWLVRAEFSRRLSNQWGVALGYYGFSNVQASPALRDFQRDTHLTISLRRYL
jgi:hypothetical protein